jgi:hypothetical protein
VHTFHRKRIGLFLVPLAAAGLTRSTAFACPNCLTGRVARASVFDQDFAANLLLIGSPLLVLAVIAALLHRIDLEPRTRRASDAATDSTP